jgi:hypothetical protein
MSDPFETRLKELAQQFDYPVTPPITKAVMTRIAVKPHPPVLSRKLAWSLAILLITVISLMAIPPVRAAVFEFIQIGIVRIFPRTEGHTPTPEIKMPLTPTSIATSSALIPLLEEIMGEVTLQEARALVEYPIPLPTYPADLNEPDRIFVQEVDSHMTILVWMDDQVPGKVKLSLHIIPPNSWVIKKVDPTVIEFTNVNGQRAIWAKGPYPLLLHNREIDFVRLIEGNVLIWTEGDLTYRLETDLSLEEAIRIAESLQAPPVETPTP